MSLANTVELWQKALQDDFLELAVLGVLLGGDEIDAVATPVLLLEKVIGVFIRPHLCIFHFSVCRSQGLARAAVEFIT